MLNIEAKHCGQFLQCLYKSHGKGFTGNSSGYLNIPWVTFIHFVLMETIRKACEAVISTGG